MNKDQISFDLDALLSFGIIRIKEEPKSAQKRKAPTKPKPQKAKEKKKPNGKKTNRGKFRSAVQKYCDMNQDSATGWCICANMYYCDYCGATGDNLSMACAEAVEEMAHELKYPLDYNKDAHNCALLIEKLEKLAEVKLHER